MALDVPIALLAKAANRTWSIVGSVEMVETRPRTSWILPLILPSSLARISETSARTLARRRSSLRMELCRSRNTPPATSTPSAIRAGTRIGRSQLRR